MAQLILQADAASLPLADQCVDLVFGSPPYCDARTYGIDAQRGCNEWIEWMLEVTRECLRVCKGPVVWVCAGVTRNRTYWPAPEGLLYRWWSEGGSCYRPCYWHRVGIPGSGGDQWFRADVEYVLCFKRDGKLPWTDNKAMGHSPRWALGGELSHRLKDGRRRDRAERFRHGPGKTVKGSHGRNICDVANPGNLIHVHVGGGLIGDSIAHENEAPFPEKLAEFFVRSFCPPGGTVLDPFSGSGTTAKVAARFGRKYIASDLRWSQCELTRRRLKTVQKELFA